MRQKVAWYFTALEYLLLFLAFVLAVSPILLVITNSIKTGAETYKVPPSLIFAPTLNNYKYCPAGFSLRAMLGNANYMIPIPCQCDERSIFS